MSQPSDFLKSLIAITQDLTGIPVQEGFFDGPLPDGQTDLGCAYIHGLREDHDTLREFIDARVRIFLTFVQPSEATSPLSLLPLYDLIETMQKGFADQAEAVAGVWFARLTEAEVNPKQYGIETQFIAFTWNPNDPVAPPL